MNMISYAIYDVDTGEVVHVHVEPAGLDSSPKEILRQADPHQTRRLGVVRVPDERALAKGVHVVEGQLDPTEREVGSGAAGGADSLVEPVAERRYEVRPPKHDSTADTD
jgi:hypothetical protein